MYNLNSLTSGGAAFVNVLFRDVNIMLSHTGEGL